jgi:hypothetical protein
MLSNETPEHHTIGPAIAKPIAMPAFVGPSAATSSDILL